MQLHTGAADRWQGVKIFVKTGKVMQAMSLLFQQKKKSTKRQTRNVCCRIQRFASGAEPVNGEDRTLVQFHIDKGSRMIIEFKKKFIMVNKNEEIRCALGKKGF